MVVVSQQGFQCFHLPVIKHAVRTTNTSVKEPQQAVYLLRWFSDAKTHQQTTNASAATTATITTMP